MASLIVPEERWHTIAAKLHGLKTRKKYWGELKWSFFAPDNTNNENPMKDWKRVDKDAFRKEIFAIITAEKSVRIVASVCDSEAAYKLITVNGQHDIYFGTYKVITERFQYFLQDVSRTSGHRTLGIIVADHRGKGDDAVMRPTSKINRGYGAVHGKLYELDRGTIPNALAYEHRDSDGRYGVRSDLASIRSG